MLTIQEITHEKFPEKLKEIKNKINKSFYKKKYSSSFIKLINQEDIKAIICLIAFFGLFALTISINIFVFLGFIISSFIYIFRTIIKEDKKSKELRKINNKAKISTIISNNRKNDKYLKKKKMMKTLKSFNEKERSVVEAINFNSQSSNSIEEMVFNILYNKIKTASIDEIQLEKEYINNYICKNKDNKYGLKIESLLKERELEERVVYKNNIVNMI